MKPFFEGVAKSQNEVVSESKCLTFESPSLLLGSTAGNQLSPTMECGAALETSQTWASLKEALVAQTSFVTLGIDRFVSVKWAW